MVRRCRLPVGIDVQLISSKPKLVQMRRIGPWRRAAVHAHGGLGDGRHESAVVDTRQILLLACGRSQRCFVRSPLEPPCRAQPRKGEPHERPRRSGAGPEPRTRIPRAGRCCGPACSRSRRPSCPTSLVSRAFAQGAKPPPNLVGKLEGAEVVTDPAPLPQDASRKRRSSPSWSRPASCRPCRSGSARTRSSSSRSARSASTAAPGGAASPAPSTPRTATAPPRTTSCSTSTTRAPSSCRTSRAAWEVSPDGKVTTLHLRRGMKWSDGAALHRRRLRVLVRGRLLRTRIWCRRRCR